MKDLEVKTRAAAVTESLLTQKNEALKAIHRLCNTALDDGDTDNVLLTKKIRAIASKAWPT